jgi:hypothetical protein
MKMLTRLATAAMLAVLVSASSLEAQSGGHNPFTWYLGANGGVLLFETPRQEKGGIPMAGGNFLITAKRTALMLSVEEGFGSDEQTSYLDPTAPGGVRNVTFNDIRKYSAFLMAYPVKSHVQPFVGVGVGIMHLHNPQALNTVTPDEKAAADSTANNLGSTGFASFVAGLQLQVSGVAVFGMYQITTSPEQGKLLTGPTHSLTAGLRFSLGGAKEGVTGGGY